MKTNSEIDNWQGEKQHYWKQLNTGETNEGGADNHKGAKITKHAKSFRTETRQKHDTDSFKNSGLHDFLA